MTTFDTLQTRANRIGLLIEEDYTECGDETWAGYWLVCLETGEGPMEDGNFSTSLEELECNLSGLEADRMAHP